MLKAFSKYLPILFVLLLLGGHGHQLAQSFEKHTSGTSLQTTQSFDLAGTLSVSIHPPVSAGLVKRNFECTLTENEVGKEHLLFDKKDSDNWASSIYCFSLSEAHSSFSHYSFNKYFSYSASHRYLAFKVFRI